MRIIKFIDKLLNFILIMFFITIILFSGYALYDVNEVYNEAELSEDILKYKPESYKEEAVEKFDLTDLQNNVNEDICGWIRIDGTNIDYPVLSSKNMTYYLDKDYNKKYSAGGSIFLHGDNDRYFTDDFQIIYGHNMVKNLMFSDINKYEDKKYFDKNSTGILYTQNEIYAIKVYTYNILNSSLDMAYDLDANKNGKNEDILKDLEASAIYKNDIEVTPEDKFVLLSTCYGVGTPQRSVLFCKLENIETSTTINDNSNSDIERDEKREEKELFNDKKRVESLNIKRELENAENRKKAQSLEQKVKEYFEDVWLTPSKLFLHILIGVTVIIYVIVIYKKLHAKKELKRDSRVYNSKIEKNNIKRILKLLGFESKTNKKKKNKIRKVSSKGKHGY